MKEHPTKSREDQSANKTTVETLVNELTQKDLAKYLTDVDLSVYTVDWLYRELGVPTSLSRLFVKGLAILVVKAGVLGGGWLTDIAVQKITRMLEGLPVFQRLTSSASMLVRYLDEEVKAKSEAQDIIQGRRTTFDVQHADRLPLELQADIVELSKLDTLSEELTESIKSLESFICPQPRLILRLFAENDTGVSRFYYGTQKLPFVGRESELEALRDFLHAGHQFSWLLVAGPPGLGKSRLALELCLQYGNAWRAGFLPTGTSQKEFMHWVPNQPTLLVADYVLSRARDLGEIVRSLYDRAENGELTFPVRILLLERDPHGDWLNEFEGVGGDAYAIRSARYMNELTEEGYLPISPLCDEDIWKLITSVFEDSKEPLPERDTTIDILKKIDQHGRPLYAALLADAMAGGHTPWQWDQSTLIYDILGREESRWQRMNVLEDEKNLLAISTMSGGIDLNDQTLPTKVNRMLASFSPERYKAMVGASATERLEPMEPDIIGEAFVLNHIKPRHARDTRRSQYLVQLAWEIGTGESMYRFLNHAGKDFLDHVSTPILFMNPPRNLTKNASLYFWAASSKSLVSHYAEALIINQAQSLYNEISQVANSSPVHSFLAEKQAEAAFNLTIGYGKLDQLQTVLTIYDEVQELTTRNPTNPVVFMQQVKILVNLSANIIHRESGMLDDVVIIYDDIKSLIDKYPEEKNLRSRQAKIAANLSAALAKKKDYDRAETFYSTIAQLAEAHPDDCKLREILTKSAGNLCSSLLGDGEIKQAENKYAEIVRLADTYEAENVLRHMQFQVANILMEHYTNNLEEVEKAQNLYENISRVVVKYPDNHKLHTIQWGLTTKLAVFYCNLKDIVNCKRMYENIKSLYRDSPENSTLRKHFGAISYILCTAHGNVGDIDNAQIVYRELSKLSLNHLDDQNLREEQAKTARFLIFYLSSCGRIKEIKKLYSDISHLAKTFFRETILIVEQAKAAAFLSDQHHLAGHDKDANWFREELMRLAEENRNLIELEKIQAEVSKVEHSL